jgi:signal transduction histidine kinase
MQSEDHALRRKAERSEAVAGLARTVQHDINNLLTVIFANLEMLKRSAAEGAPQRQLGRVEEAARRFEGTSRSILALIRRPAGEVVPIRLSEVLGAVQPLLHMILPGPGALSVTLAEKDPPVLLERSALEEALLTLAQQIADTQPRGPALALTVAPEPAEGVLTVRLPAGLALPAMARLAAACTAVGGSAAPADADGEEALCLRLPRHSAGP